MTCCHSVTKSCSILWEPTDCSMLGLPIPHNFPEFAQVHFHYIGDAIQPSHPLSHSSPCYFSLWQHYSLFTWVSSSHQVAKVLEFQLHHQSFQGIFRLISFKIAWFYLPAVQGTLKSLLQHRSSKASILWRSGFFIVQLSHPYMTIGKTIASLDGPLLAKWCLCFVMRCLGLS